MQRAPNGDATAWRPERVLFVSGSAASATLRYRVRLPEEGLRARGTRTAALHFTDPRIRHLAPKADVVVLYRCPASKDLLQLLAELRRGPSPPLVTYDIDDLVFTPDHCSFMPFLCGWQRPQRENFQREVALRGMLVPAADLLTGSTLGVVSELARLSPAPSAVLPNGIGRVGLADAEQASHRRRPHEGFRIGYFSGSPTHDSDWAEIESTVIAHLVANPTSELWLVGKVNPSAALAGVRRRVRVVPPTDWRRLPDLLAAVDVTLAPLARNPFTDSKSSIKWLESALVGTVSIATPTPPFRAVIEHGRTGFLAPTPAAWGDWLDRLADDPQLVAEVGSAARESALTEFGPELQTDRLLIAWSTARDGPSGTRPAPGPSDLGSLWREAPILLQGYPWPAGLDALDLELPPETRSESVRLERAARLSRLTARAVGAPRRLPYLAAQRARSLLGRRR